MNLMLSQLTQLPVAADPTDVTLVQPADAGAAAVPENQDAASQATPAFNDALLNIVNSLLGGEQPRDNAMVLADVKAKDDSDDDQDTQTPDAQTLAQNLIGSPQQLLDALLMASRMPTKTLNATPESVPLPGDRLKMQSFAVGNPPIATPLKAVPQPMTLSLTPEPATDAAIKPAMTEFTKTLATVLPVAGQPTAVQTPSTVTDKQPVNLPPIKMDADEAKWAQQLHSALNDRLQIQVRNQVQHATVRLDPPEMGKVDISLQIENGRMQVHISASNGETYRSLQQISNELRQSLTEQNFVQVNVQVSSQSGQHQQRQQQSGSAQEANPMAGAVIDADDGFTTADHDDSVLLTV